MADSKRPSPPAGREKPMLSTRTWVLILCVAALALGAVSWLTLGGRKGTVVRVVQDGQVLREIDLARVTEEYSFTVEYPEGGSNTVTVRPGAIRVSEADCPDKVCVSQGWITDRGGPVVCLPHRLVLELAESADIDASAR